MKQWTAVLLVIAASLEYTSSDEVCPQEFTVCPEKEVLTSPGDSVILHCITKETIKSCEWRTPFAKEGIIIMEDDPDYKKYNPTNQDNSCNLEIVDVKDEDYGNWTCTPVVEGERQKQHSTPAFVSFATTPQPPYLVANEKMNPRTVNVTEGHPVTVTCKVDGSRPAPGMQWYLGNPFNGSITKNLTASSETKSLLIDDHDTHMLLKTKSDLTVNEDSSMNGQFVWCNLTHMSLSPGDEHMAYTKLNISYSPKFSDITSNFQFQVNSKASFKLQFTANPGPEENNDVKLLIGSRDSISSGKLTDDKAIELGKAEPVQGQSDAYQVEIIFHEITLEHTKNNYMLSVSNHIGNPSMHKFVVVVYGSEKKDSHIGLIIGAVVSATLLIFLVAFSIYAYKKSKFCFAPSEHISVPVEPVPRPKKRTKDMRNMSMIKRHSKEDDAHQMA